jgi:hypothetical protein
MERNIVVGGRSRLASDMPDMIIKHWRGVEE